MGNHNLPILGSLLVLGSCASTEAAATGAEGRGPVSAVAVLGASTRAPTAAEVATFGLSFEVRARGQVVVEVERGGSASGAGIEPGDVLVKLGAVDLFSRDDIDDVLRVSEPGQRIEAVVVRGKTTTEESVTVRLDTSEAAAPKDPILEWQFASLGQLADALTTAKREGRLILVGLSGAET